MNLGLLRQCLNQYGNNTANMVNILNSFEERLENLEKTIIPVYNETENLRRRQESILYYLFVGSKLPLVNFRFNL